MINKKLILIIALLIVALAVLTLLKKSTMEQVVPEPVVETPQEQQNAPSTPEANLEFTGEDRVFCTESGCTLLSCSTGTIEDIQDAPEGEIPHRCSDGSEMNKQVF